MMIIDKQRTLRRLRHIKNKTPLRNVRTAINSFIRDINEDKYDAANLGQIRNGAIAGKMF